MTARTVINRLHDGMTRFRTHVRGNVVITFTLTLIPIMGPIGAAVDYGRANLRIAK
jgi:Flp pilus assembly protein TadG